jgi:vesicular inhibitory amino acid transporter
MSSENEDIEVPLLNETTIERSISGASVMSTCFIILSIYVGLGLLSQPFGLRVAGWSGGLLCLVFTAALFFSSAHFLTKACDLLPPGVSQTFPVLGHALAGNAGRVGVTVLAGMEIFGAITIGLVIVLQQLELLLPSEGLFSLSPLTLACMIAVAGLIPTLALRDISRLGPIAAAGSGASAAVAIAVLSLLVVDPGRKYVHQPPAQHSVAHFPGGMLQSIGIFAVSMSGHASLPGIRSKMQSPRKFSYALGASFGIMAGVYGVVAAAGYYYWGDDVSALATFDLATNSAYSSSGGGGGSGSGGGQMWHQWLQIDRILASLVLITCSAKVPALIMVVEEFLSGVLPARSLQETTAADVSVHQSQQQQQTWQRRSQFVSRVVIAACALSLGVAARNELGNILSVVGGFCSISTSLILPAAFYAKLSWETHSNAVKMGLGGMFLCGGMLLVQVTYQGAKKLSQ